MTARQIDDLGLIGLGVALIVGWIMNIVAVIGLIGGDVSAELIVRVVGVFVAPLGAAFGYLL